MSITHLVRSLDQQFLASIDLPPPEEIDVPVRGVFPAFFDDTATFGEELHDAFHQANQNGHVGWAYRPYVAAINAWLDGSGATAIRTEWCCYAKEGLPEGVLDAVVYGGPARMGVLEIKSEHNADYSWYRRDAVQAACYARLLRAWRIEVVTPWVALLYARPGADRLRVYLWSDGEMLQQAAEKVSHWRLN